MVADATRLGYGGQGPYGRAKPLACRSSCVLPPVFAAQFHNLMCEHTFDIEFRRIIGAGCADAAIKPPQHGWGATEAVQESYPPHDRSGPCHFRPIKWLLALA